MITIEILAEIRGHGSHKGLFDYGDHGYLGWVLVPALQMSNRWILKEQVRKHLVISDGDVVGGPIGSLQMCV